MGGGGCWWVSLHETTLHTQDALLREHVVVISLGKTAGRGWEGATRDKVISTGSQ